MSSSDDEDQQQDEIAFDDSDEEYTVNSFTAATRLLEKRKEMFEIRNTLKAKRDEFQERLKSIKEKERGLSKKRGELTDNIIELDKFIGDNEIKRTRADQKQKKEEEDRIKSEEKIRDLRQEIEQKKKQRAILAEKVKRDSKYHNYMRQVVILRGNGDPENVEAVIKRYRDLEDNRNKVSKLIDKRKIAVNEKKKKLKEDNENWKKSTIELNHIISTHVKTLENLQKENNANRKKLELTQVNDNDLQVSLGKIEMACTNLYDRVCDNQNGSKITRSQQNPDSLKMLKVIGDCLSDFNYVLSVYKGLSEAEKAKVLKANST